MAAIDDAASLAWPIDILERRLKDAQFNVRHFKEGFAFAVWERRAAALELALQILREKKEAGE